MGYLLQLKQKNRELTGDDTSRTKHASLYHSSTSDIVMKVPSLPASFPFVSLLQKLMSEILIFYTPSSSSPDVCSGQPTSQGSLLISSTWPSEEIKLQSRPMTINPYFSYDFQDVGWGWGLV